MNYAIKRRNAGLKAPYVAYKLGISLKNYKEVENGQRGLASKKIDEFNQIINSGASARLEQMQLMREANNWYLTADTRKIMADMGYNFQELADVMGNSRSKCYYYISKTKGRTTDEGILEFYIFLTDENNKKYVPKEATLFSHIDNLVIEDPRFTHMNEVEKPKVVEVATPEGIIETAENLETAEVKEEPKIEEIKPIEEPKKEDSRSLKDDYIEYLSEENRLLRRDFENVKDNNIEYQVRIKELEAQVYAKNELISTLEGLLRELNEHN